MKSIILASALLSLCLPAVAQSPEAIKYAPFALTLVNPQPDSAGVMPMVFTEDGKQRLDFISIDQIKESLDRGGQPVRLGDVLSVLKTAADSITKLQAENSRLQAENDKLWKVAMKDAPPPVPQTVVVQQPSQPSPLERYMLLRSMIPQAQPYRLPQPVNPNAGRLQTNCRTTSYGGTSTTNCN